MNKFKVGQKVRTVGPKPGYGTSGYPAPGFVGTIKYVPGTTEFYNKYYRLEEVSAPFIELELEAVESDVPVSPDKVDSFRKATELLPDGLVEDRIQLAEWLIKDG